MGATSSISDRAKIKEKRQESTCLSGRYRRQERNKPQEGPSERIHTTPLHEVGTELTDLSRNKLVVMRTKSLQFYVVKDKMCHVQHQLGRSASSSCLPSVRPIHEQGEAKLRDNKFK